MDSSSPSLSPELVEFQDLPSEICNNQNIHSYFTVTGDYIPHRLDKIHLCPVDYTTDFQELNTWEFVSCRKTDNEMYPYEGEVTFPSEKYGFLVLDNANASGYTLKYVNKDGINLGETNIFSILLEETESAMLGMSFVFLPDELTFPQTVESDSVIPEAPKNEIQRNETPVPEYLPSLNLSEPTPSLFPLNLSGNEPIGQIRSEQLEFLEDTVKEMKEHHQELEDRYDTKVLECEQVAQFNTELREDQENCKAHRKGFEIFANAFAQLAQALILDGRAEQVPDALVNSLLAGTENLAELGEQLNRLIEAANIQKAENESLVLENRKLKDECKNLQAVVQDYKTQLILTNQEQAQITDKMSQLQQDQDILKTYELPPKKEISPAKMSRQIIYPPKCRPKHLPIHNGPYEATQSIIMTEPAKGPSYPTFPTMKFLKSCSIHEEEGVRCPICQKEFEKGETNFNRTKHVNRCMETSHV